MRITESRLRRIIRNVITETYGSRSTSNRDAIVGRLGLALGTDELYSDDDLADEILSELEMNCSGLDLDDGQINAMIHRVLSGYQGIDMGAGGADLRGDLVGYLDHVCNTGYTGDEYDEY